VNIVTDGPAGPRHYWFEITAVPVQPDGHKYAVIVVSNITSRKIAEVKQNELLTQLTSANKELESYGGRIWVESEPGKGATFHLTLPKAPEPKTTEELAISVSA